MAAERPAGGYLFNMLKNKLKGDSSRGDKTIAEMKTSRAAANAEREAKAKNRKVKPVTKPVTKPVVSKRSTGLSNTIASMKTSRAAANAEREAKAKNRKVKPAAAKAANRAVMAEQIAARNAKEKARQGKAIAKTAVSRPTPKRPSAISLQNAATPKPTRLMKPEVPPTSRVKPSGTGAAKTNNDMKKPASGLANVTGTPQGKTGSPRRNVGSGREKKANVTKEQLTKTGLTLRDYLNFMDKNSRRPTKADAAAAKKLTAGFKAKKAKKMMGGGMAMKSKGYAKGGMAMKTKMGTKGGAMGGAKGYKDGGRLPMVEKDGQMIPAYAADGKGKMMAGGKVKSKGMARGGMMKTKGYSKGGAMKTKGYSTGGVLKGKKNKVRGAGIARKGVRPAKML